MLTALCDGVRNGRSLKGGMRKRRQVAADAQVNRLARLDRCGDCSIEKLMCILQILYHILHIARTWYPQVRKVTSADYNAKYGRREMGYVINLSARNLLEAAILLAEIRFADRVMEDAVRPEVVRVRPTNDADHGEVFAVGTGYGVYDAQTPDGERHGASAHAVGAGVPVRGVARVELVAAADELELRLGDQVVQEDQVEVTGDGEDVAHSYLDEAAGNVAPQRPLRLKLYLSDDRHLSFLSSAHFASSHIEVSQPVLKFGKKTRASVSARRYRNWVHWHGNVSGPQLYTTPKRRAQIWLCTSLSPSIYSTLTQKVVEALEFTQADRFYNDVSGISEVKFPIAATQCQSPPITQPNVTVKPNRTRAHDELRTSNYSRNQDNAQTDVAKVSGNGVVLRRGNGSQ